MTPTERLRTQARVEILMRQSRLDLSAGLTIAAKRCLTEAKTLIGKLSPAAAPPGLLEAERQRFMLTRNVDGWSELAEAARRDGDHERADRYESLARERLASDEMRLRVMMHARGKYGPSECWPKNLRLALSDGLAQEQGTA
jgi:hypothetical protein